MIPYFVNLLKIYSKLFPSAVFQERGSIRPFTKDSKRLGTTYESK